MVLFWYKVFICTRTNVCFAYYTCMIAACNSIAIIEELKVGDYTISRKELATLHPKKWLSDAVGTVL